MTTPHPRDTAPASRPRSNLQLRAITAVVGLPVVALLIWIGGWPFAVAAGIVAVLAAAEFVHGWLMPSLPIRNVLPHAPMFALSGLAVTWAHWDERAVALAAILAVMMAAAGFLAPTSLTGPRKPYRVQAGALVYIGILLSTLVLLRDLDNGRQWVYLAILATFAVDTGAYAVGRAIGRHKLAPRISPAKTIEGAVGGYVSGTAAVMGMGLAFDVDATAAELAPIALLLPPVAIAGDLLESWMKRRMGVKDASGLLPGHGGFLDRLDSILLVAPLVYGFVRLVVV